MKPILECYGLSKSYSNGRMALSNLNLSLERGQIIGLLGPNGSGKTTLIKLINDLLVPTEGYADLISYFEDFYEDFQRNRAEQMLEALGIELHAKLRTLSKGAREKVQLVMVMSRDASLYVLDEPIGGVDPASRDYILNTILTNYNENATILLSTHLISDIENILDRVLFLQNGQMVLNASVDDIRMEQKKSVDMLFREVFRC